MVLFGIMPYIGFEIGGLLSMIFGLLFLAFSIQRIASKVIDYFRLL
jgi:hypothetical protein